MDRHILHTDPDFRKGDDATEREELQRLAPTLFAIKSEEPFQVPAHFFDRLPHEVQAKVVEQQQKPAAFAWLWRLAIAAPVAAVLFGAWWFTRNTGTDNDPDIAALTGETTPTPTRQDEGAIDDLEGLEEDDLLAALAEDDDLGSIAVDMELTDDELLHYLDQENTNLDELISEL